MKIAFRVDASIQIGTGHLVRCQTLADALRRAGADIRFLCRAHPGNMAELLEKDGFSVSLLPAPSVISSSEEDYAVWLGVTEAEDLAQTTAVLRAYRPDWLIVDHYGLGIEWEKGIRNQVSRIMVIDDLADRRHDCDLLLDQNCVVTEDSCYQVRTAAHCRTLLGPSYALVRPEFAALRSESLKRRQRPVLDRLLIFMGGSDPTDEASRVLESLCLARKRWQRVDVVIGKAYAMREKLHEIVRAARLPAGIHIQTPAMARLMLEADVAVTSGGSVSWEKCTLGLPSLVAVTGENQVPIARSLHAAGAQVTIGYAKDLSVMDYARHIDSLTEEKLISMTKEAQAICDGEGVARVAAECLRVIIDE